MALRTAFLVTVVVGVVFNAPLLAQDTASGTITGTVRDTSGAVLPGVTVEVASPALIEQARTAVTDTEGRYRIGALRPGVYSVTFSLPGFRGVRREGLALTTGFIATVDSELSVGALEETITVTGAAPLVDTRSSSQQAVMSGDLLRSLPLPKNSAAYVTLLPGAVQRNLQDIDVGGTKGETSAAFGIHGGRPTDGYRFREGLYDGAVTCTFSSNPFSSINPATIQEVTIQLTGGLTAEAPTGGTQTNVVLRDGGNRVGGTFQVDFGHGNLQSTNVDADLRARGVGTQPSIKQLHDYSAGVGGPIVRDKVWFFGDAREWVATSYLAGIYFNSRQGTLFYEPDLSRPGFAGTRNVSGGLRVTWQISEKDKLAVTGTYEHTYNPHFGLDAGTSAPEAAGNHRYRPQKMVQGTWTRPVTDRLLLQVGALKVGGHIWFLPWNNDISVQNRLTNFRYGSTSSNTSRVFTQANVTGSASYVTGAHTLKVGGSYMDAFRNEAPYINGSISYTFAGTVPESVTYYAYPLDYGVKLKIAGLFVQDQWTLNDFTLNAGVRYDYLNGHSLAATSPAGPWVGERSFDPVYDTPDWKDLNPRVGVAYNLFGGNRTVIKASVGRFLSFESTNGVVNTANPSAATVTQATRTWRDANGDYVPQESELGPLSNTRFGQSVINTRFADDVIQGFGVRPYHWQGSLVVQHELRSGLALNVGYFRTWYGNFQVTDNLQVTAADYESYCVNGPPDSRLPGGGGERICGLLDVVPTKFGLVDNLIRHSSDFGSQSEVYNGFDVTLQARFGNGGLIAGGFSTARTVTDDCEVKEKVPESAGSNAAAARFCKVTPPWSAATQVKLSGTYTLPWDVRLGGVYQNIPGVPTTATFVTTAAANPEILATLGRPLSGGANRTTSVELVAPQSMYLDGRIQILNFNVAKIFRFDRARIEPNVSLSNALNTNPVQVQVLRYGPAWRNVTGMLPARTVKLGVRMDF